MKKRIILAVLLVLCAAFLAACGGAKEWKGTYVYQENESYSLDFSGNGCVVYYGSNMFSADMTKNEDGSVHVVTKGMFWNIDFTAVMENNQVLVTGDIGLKKANGGKDPSSLTGLDRAVFVPKR